MPALGMSVTGFTKVDQDRGLDQNVPLGILSPTASVEWATDWLALLVGGSPVYSISGLKLQSWTVALGIAVSPF